MINSKFHNRSFENKTSKVWINVFILSNDVSCYGLFIWGCKFVQTEPGLNNFTRKYSLYWLCELLFEIIPAPDFNLIIKPASGSEHENKNKQKTRIHRIILQWIPLPSPSIGRYTWHIYIFIIYVLSLFNSNYFISAIMQVNKQLCIYLQYKVTLLKKNPHMMLGMCLKRTNLCSEHVNYQKLDTGFDIMLLINNEDGKNSINQYKPIKMTF